VRISVLRLSCGVSLSPFSTCKDPNQAIDGCEDRIAEASDDAQGEELWICLESLLMPSLHTIEETSILCAAIGIQVRKRITLLSILFTIFDCLCRA
jgi:hypothetical protein